MAPGKAAEYLEWEKTRNQRNIFKTGMNELSEYYADVTVVSGVPENPQNSFETGDKGALGEGGRCTVWFTQVALQFGW